MRFLTVLVLLVLSACALGVGHRPGLLASRVEAAELEHSMTAIDAVLTFQPEDVATMNDGEFDRITLRGADVDRFSSHAGQPQLPVVVKWFLLPANSTVADLRVELAGWQQIPGEFIPLPVPSMDDQDGAPPEAPDWPQQLYPAAPGLVLRV